MEIKNRYTGKTIVEGKDFLECLEKCNKNLTGANLAGADLTGANLTGANLSGAIVLYKPNLDLLKYISGSIICWKYMVDGKSPYQGATYEVGNEYEAKINTNIYQQCGHGINVASLNWCYYDAKGKSGKITFFECEVVVNSPDDVIIPLATDGKFRVKKIKVLREIGIKEAEKMLSNGKEKK